MAPFPKRLRSFRSGFRYSLLLSTAVLCMAGVSAQAEKPQFTPVIAEASEEAENLTNSFRIPEGMKAKLFASEPMLANPVVFCVDHLGRFYVAETFRHSEGVMDNRGHLDWLHDDLAAQTVADREKMFRKFLGSQIAEFETQHERIRLISDSDEDGVADKSTVFADHFGHLMDGIGAGLLAYRGKVYYACVPKLWLLEDQNNDGIADREEALFDGFGVRVAFLGHDLHGLCLGPDGRIYFSMGDRGYNVITKEGKRLKRPYTGAVFRCEPDGSDLEVFAYGLRNPQELAFDDFGNLFTGDNNCDSGDLARWVYVAEGSDSGWRMYFQYLSDRGPWNREKMWHLQNEEQPAYMIPPLAHVGSGPSGLASYPGVGLSDRYQGHFFLADFRGSKAISGIRSLAMKPKGAGFEVIDHHEFLWNIVGTDVDFDYEGNLCVLDWTDGWNKPGKGRIYRFFDPEELRKQKMVLNGGQLLKEGLEKQSIEKLTELLHHPDRRIRQEAQFILVEKNAVSALESVARNSDHQISRVHAIWGLGQLARNQKHVTSLFTELVTDPDPEIRAQAIRTVGDSGIDLSSDRLIRLLKDSNPRVQALTAIAAGRLQKQETLLTLCELLRENEGRDPFLKHAGVMGLWGISKSMPNALNLAAKSPSASVRMGALLAMRRSGSSEIQQFLNDTDSQLVLEAARAINDEPIESEMNALAELGKRDLKSDPLARRVMNACYRSGTLDNAESVAQLAVNSSLSESVRLEALYELETWNEPDMLDRVDGRWRPVPERDPVDLSPVVASVFQKLLTGEDSIREKTIRLAALYSVRESLPALLDYARDPEKNSSVRVEALKGLAKLNEPELISTVTGILNKQEKSPEVRSECRKIIAEKNPSEALSLIEKLFQEESTSFEKQEGVRILASMNLKEANSFLYNLLKQATEGHQHPEVLLDLLEVAGTSSDSGLADLASRYEKARSEQEGIDQFRESLAGGDREKGRDIFFNRTDASCGRCHKIQGKGSDVGPDLSHVSKEKTREYLLESIVAPNNKIAKGYETITLAMADGKLISGILKSETDKEVVLATGSNQEVTIRIHKEDIDDRTEAKSGMPLDLAKVLSKRDLRDLVEFLSSLK